MKAIAVSANEWLYPDVSEYQSASGTINLHAPRGGYASVQLFLPETEPGAPIAVSCEGLDAPEAYQMLDVKVNGNVGSAGGLAKEGEDPSGWVTRLAPFYVYDVLQPFDQGGNVAEKEQTALYLCWPIAKDAKPGIKSGAVTITVGGASVRIPASITVRKATLPEHGWLSITNWYNGHNISKPYGIAPYSEEWFAMYGKFMKLMQRTRQTHIIINLHSIGIAELGDGRYAFDFSNIQRIIQMAVDAGFKTLELGHLGVRNYRQHEPIWLFYPVGGKRTYVRDKEAYPFLAQFLKAWADFLKENGWYHMCVQHVSDEPTMKTADDYRILSAIIRKFMPGVPLFDAIVHPELRGASDFWIPYNSIYEEQREQWEELRDLGDEIWCYTCTAPGGKWLNRTLDMELLRPRLMHWGNYRFDLKGYLHWGFNYWHVPEGEKDMTAYLRGQSVVLIDGKPRGWPAGDSHICYPGNPSGPWMSARAERMRAGAEDCELLQMIASSDKRKADEICANVLRAFNDYTTDVNAFDENYIRLLDAADVL